MAKKLKKLTIEEYEGMVQLAKMLGNYKLASSIEREYYTEYPERAIGMTPDNDDDD